MPLLSIITPVFNNVAFIAIAIENYLSQSCTESELIIMDGGSTDGTKEVIIKYASENACIKYVSEKDEGQSDAMNKGLLLAKGIYISFLNVDDFYSEGCLNEVCTILANHPSIHYLVGDCNVWDQFGKLIYVNRPSKVKKWHVFSGYHFSVNPSAYFYRKSLHDQVGFYPNDNHYNMDLEMILRFRAVTQFHYYPKVWGNFRMLPNAKTFEDIKSNSLKIRKEELLRKYLVKQNFKIQLFVFLYILKKKYHPILKKIYLVIRDKIRFEISKLKLFFF
jgi:glycosyltransferase involved in cell wall biosynthesis